MTQPGQKQLIELGNVTSLVGGLRFTIEVNEQGAARLNIYAWDPSNMRKHGCLLTLGADGVGKLSDLLLSARATLDQLRQDGKIRGMLPLPARDRHLAERLTAGYPLVMRAAATMRPVTPATVRARTVATE